MRLKEVRKLRGLTQKEVAEQVGVNQNTYSYWENEKTHIDSSSLKKVAEIFGVSVDYLLGGEPLDYTVASPNGNQGAVTTSDVRINRNAPLRSEHEKLLSVYDSLDDVSKTQLMSVAYMLMSASLKTRGIDVQQIVEQQLHKLQDEGGGENDG